MMSQKEGVFNAVTSLLQEQGREFEQGSTKVQLSADERKTVVETLVAATEAGELKVGGKAAANLSKYWSGTLSNWLRKDERLNGGEEYKIKNPGSRTGARDPQIQALKALLQRVQATGDEQNTAKVKEALEKRKAELAAEKVKQQVEINSELLPESLRHMVEA